MEINATNLKELALQKQKEELDTQAENAVTALKNILPMLYAAAEDGYLEYTLTSNTIPSLLGIKLKTPKEYVVVLQKVSELLTKEPYNFKINLRDIHGMGTLTLTIYWN